MIIVHEQNTTAKLWKNFFSESNSYFRIYAPQSSKITIFRAKTMTLYSSAKWCKNYSFNFIFMRNFVQKIMNFRKNTQFCARLVSYWYEIYAKFCAKRAISWKNSNRIFSLKYLRSSSLDWKDIAIRKSEFVAKTQFHRYVMYHSCYNFENSFWPFKKNISLNYKITKEMNMINYSENQKTLK